MSGTHAENHVQARWNEWHFLKSWKRKFVVATSGAVLSVLFRWQTQIQIYRYIRTQEIYISTYLRIPYDIKELRPSAFYVSFFFCTSRCCFPVLHAKTFDSESAKSHATGLKLISIYVSFQKYARIFLLSR